MQSWRLAIPLSQASIDVCLDEMVLATPIRPTTLVFAPSEEMVVAVPNHTAAGVGEYQFLFTIETYLEDGPDRGGELFGRPAWRHIYRLGSATTIAPFSLDDAKALLTDVPSLMRDGTYRQLPMIAAVDLHEAAVCIAFERPTAVAFHSLRATEAVLRHYYSCAVIRKRIRKPWLWKRMLEELQKPRRVRRPYGAVLDHLDSIRKRFRNPTQHPEKLYDIEEAQNLFGQSLSVIEAMVADEPWTEPADSVEAYVRERTQAAQLRLTHSRTL